MNSATAQHNANHDLDDTIAALLTNTSADDSSTTTQETTTLSETSKLTITSTSEGTSSFFMKYTQREYTFRINAIKCKA